MQNRIYWQVWHVRYFLALNKLNAVRYSTDLADFNERWAAKIRTIKDN